MKHFIDTKTEERFYHKTLVVLFREEFRLGSLEPKLLKTKAIKMLKLWCARDERVVPQFTQNGIRRLFLGYIIFINYGANTNLLKCLYKVVTSSSLYEQLEKWQSDI